MAYDLEKGEALLKLVTEAIYDTREMGAQVSRTEAAIFAHAALNAIGNSGFQIDRKEEGSSTASF